MQITNNRVSFGVKIPQGRTIKQMTDRKLATITRQLAQAQKLVIEQQQTRELARIAELPLANVIDELRISDKKLAEPRYLRQDSAPEIIFEIRDRNPQLRQRYEKLMEKVPTIKIEEDLNKYAINTHPIFRSDSIYRRRLDKLPLAELEAKMMDQATRIDNYNKSDADAKMAVSHRIENTFYIIKGTALKKVKKLAESLSEDDLAQEISAVEKKLEQLKGIENEEIVSWKPKKAEVKEYYVNKMNILDSDNFDPMKNCDV